MSDFSRHTTAKGQMMLNIRPPSPSAPYMNQAIVNKVQTNTNNVVLA